MGRRRGSGCGHSWPWGGGGLYLRWGGNRGWPQRSFVLSHRAAPVLRPWLHGWGLFLDGLGPLGALLPKLRGRPAGVPSPRARRAPVSDILTAYQGHCLCNLRACPGEGGGGGPGHALPWHLCPLWPFHVSAGPCPQLMGQGGGPLCLSQTPHVALLSPTQSLEAGHTGAPGPGVTGAVGGPIPEEPQLLEPPTQERGCPLCRGEAPRSAL